MESDLTTKRDDILIHTMWMNLENVEANEAITEGHVLYDSICGKRPESANPYGQEAEWCRA